MAEEFVRGLPVSGTRVCPEATGFQIQIVCCCCWACGLVGNASSRCPQIHRLTRARRIAACATCLARGKNLPDWRGRHGADLNGQVSNRRRAPHRAEHACRGSIPVIADRVHVRCCRRRRLAGCFCARAAKLRFLSAVTVIAARFTAHKAVHRRRGATPSARLGGAIRPAGAVG